jgi:hypothetical protein
MFSVQTKRVIYFIEVLKLFFLSILFADSSVGGIVLFVATVLPRAEITSTIILL